jgi:hypothetical protein
MNAWATVGLVVGWLGSAAFLFPYVFLVKGWRHDAHRVHVVAFSGDVFGFFTLYLLRPLIEPHVFQWIRFVLLWVLALLAVWRAVIFLGGLIRGVRRRRGTPLDVR